MTKLTATSRKLMGLMVIVVLLFAIGASGQGLVSEQPSNSPTGDQKVPLASEAAPVNKVDKTKSAKLEAHIPDAVRWHAIAWAVQKKEGIPLKADHVETAHTIYEETPLSLEAALYLAYYCDIYSVEPALVLSIIEVESKFNQHAVGKSKDRGYMQIIPSTERWLARSYGKELGFDYNPDKIFQPEYNLGLAIRYIADLEDKYGNNDHRVLSEYNRGSVRLANYFRQNQTYQTTYSRSILRRMPKYEDQNP